MILEVYVFEKVPTLDSVEGAPHDCHLNTRPVAVGLLSSLQFRLSTPLSGHQRPTFKVMMQISGSRADGRRVVECRIWLGLVPGGSAQ
jgi:hypothetical protein